MACKPCTDADCWPPRLIVTTVDGQEHCGAVEDWAEFPADQISRIDVGRRQLAGHSFYWLYAESITETETAWVAGGFSIHNREASEYLFRESGEVLGRRVKSIPDLYHDQVKLGWWWK